MKIRRRHIKKKVRYLKVKKPILKRLFFGIIVLFLIIILLFLYFFVFFSKIQVNSIVVSGNNNVSSKVLENIAWNNVNKKIITLGNWNLISKSIFFTKSKIISKDILNKFPQIESVIVLKKYPQIITLEVKERTPFAIFCQTDDKKCFYIDENGIIFKILEQISENDFIIKKLTEDKEVFIGERVIEKNTIDIISKIKKNFKNNFQIDIKSVTISTQSRLDVETSENWQIYFNLDSETDLQIAKMNILLKDEITASVRKTLQYIDLRFKDKAFYK